MSSRSTSSAMRRHKVLVVLGTRPEAIKLAPLIREMRRHRQFRVHVCATAQHRQMLDQVLRLFDITPEYDLHVMRPGQSLEDVTSRVLTGVREVLAKDRPDLVLVQGDTTTTFTTSLACYYQQRGRHAEAIEEFNKTIFIDPRHVRAYNGKGVSHVRLGQFEKPAEAYEGALKIDPQLDYVHNNLGYSHLLRGNYDAAIAPSTGFNDLEIFCSNIFVLPPF